VTRLRDSARKRERARARVRERHVCCFELAPVSSVETGDAFFATTEYRVVGADPGMGW
jgi:hypothetical protein